MAEITVEDVEAGQAIYNKLTLAAYDFWVLGVSNRWVWKCPTEKLLIHFNQHISANHLDVGVGTGYFMDRCTFPSDSPRIALMDMNENSLSASEKRIQRYKPTLYQRNILQKIEFDEKKFESISLNYVLHCLPGDMSYKCDSVDNLLELVVEGGVIFGSTILSSGVPVSGMAKRLMTIYNAQKTFTNRKDSYEQLEAQLQKRLKQVNIKTYGCVAMFSGYKE